MRKGDWIQTYTGKQFWPLDPRPQDFCIEDIAHALSLQCRFGGHCSQFYSVAEHCVLAAQLCSDPLWGLLHDAAEAYLVDLPRPIKESMPEYKEIEKGIMRWVIKLNHLSPVPPPDLETVDRRLLLTEKLQCMSEGSAPWSFPQWMEPYDDVQLRFAHPRDAENAFLTVFNVVTHGRAIR